MGDGNAQWLSNASSGYPMMQRTNTTTTDTALAEHTAEWDALFRRMISGDDAAFGKLWSAFNGKLQRYIAKQLGTGPHVEDLLQELWMRVIRLRESPKKEREEKAFHVQAFLFRIAHNLVIDFLRTRKEHAQIDSVDDAYHPTTQARDLSDPEDLAARALEMLPFDFREVLVLNLHLGYRFDEIAEMLEKSPDAIWARASRARAKLRRLVVELAEREGISLKAYLPNDSD